MKISSLLFLSENVHFSRISAQEEKKEILPLLWFNLLIGIYSLKIANFSENLGTEKTTMSQLISPKSSSVTSPPTTTSYQKSYTHITLLPMGI